MLLLLRLLLIVVVELGIVGVEKWSTARPAKVTHVHVVVALSGVDQAAWLLLPH